MKVIENLYYTKQEHPRHTLDVYLPDAETFPVFIYFHGGGIRAGSKNGHKFISWLQERGIAVVSANYRLYPDAAYPDFIRDAAATVAWSYKHMPEYGDVTGYFVGGSSAGGYLTQMLCFDPKYLKMHKLDADAVTGYVMDAGQPTVHFNVLVERGMDSKRVVVDEAAPLYHVTSGRNYPPMQIIVAENDMQNRPEQTNLLISTLKHFGYDMEKLDYRYMAGFGHCKYVGAFDEQGDSIFGKMILEFIEKTLA